VVINRGGLRYRKAAMEQNTNVWWLTGAVGLGLAAFIVTLLKMNSKTREIVTQAQEVRRVQARRDELIYHRDWARSRGDRTEAQALNRQIQEHEQELERLHSRRDSEGSELPLLPLKRE